VISSVNQQFPEPKPEFPTDDMIGAYGALAFLYMRSKRHARWPVEALRLIVQPPIDLQQLRIFNQDGIPRAACSWAHLSPEAEALLVGGEILKPAQWRSGDSMWLMEVIAPYEQGSGGRVLRAFMRDLPKKIQRFRYLRVENNNRAVKIVEFNRRESGGWHAPVIAKTLKELGSGRRH